MEIIDFPGRKPRAIKINAEHKMQLGPMRFTCDCGNVSDVSISGGIFKYIEFYCTTCGTPYKITNPAFVKPIPKRPKP